MTSNNIIHCLEDDFKTFLDKSYYINISKTCCGHSKYNKTMFNHHNPLMNIDHYNYFVRCVSRFRDLLQKQEHKLFMVIIVNREYDSHTELKEKIINFNNKFSNYTKNYTLLIIIHYPNKKKNHHVFTYINNIHFLELQTVSKSNGIEFYNSNDNIYLDNILKSNYKFNVKK